MSTEALGETVRLVENLNITDEFELISPKTAMKKILKKLEANPQLTFLIEDSKKGVCGMIDAELIREMEKKGRKVKKGTAQSNMLTNLLEIIDKTPLERLPLLLPEKQPDAVIVNNVAGEFVGFLSTTDFQEVLSLLGQDIPEKSEERDIGDVQNNEFVDSIPSAENAEAFVSPEQEVAGPPKPSRGPPPSRQKNENKTAPIPEPERPAIIVEEITDDDIEDGVEAFFSRVKGRSKGEFTSIHGKLADDAWGGPSEDEN